MGISGTISVHAAVVAQGLERLTVAQEVGGSRPLSRPNSYLGSPELGTMIFESTQLIRKSHF
jgi:hypothetical protein